MSALVTVSSPTRPQSRVVEGLRGQQGALPPGKGLLAPWLGHPRLQLRPDIRGRPVETCGLVQDRVQWPSSPGSILPAGRWASRNWLVLPPIPVGGGGQWGLRQDSPRPATMEAGTWAPHLRPGTGQPRQPLTSTWARPAPPPAQPPPPGREQTLGGECGPGHSGLWAECGSRTPGLWVRQTSVVGLVRTRRGDGLPPPGGVTGRPPRPGQPLACWLVPGPAARLAAVEKRRDRSPRAPSFPGTAAWLGRACPPGPPSQGHG